LVITIISALVTALLTLWNTNEGFRNAVTGAWNSLKTTAKDVFGTISDFFTVQIPVAFQTVIDFIKNNWQSLLLFITNPIAGAIKLLYDLNPKFREWADGIGVSVKDGLNSAIKWITSLPAEALEWGKDIVDGIANGIKAAASAVGDAVESVAQNIRDFLHFSEPDKGPLSDFHTYMPDMMKLLVYGITNNMGIVSKAASGVGSAISDGITDNYSVVEKATNNMLTMIDGKLDDLQTLIDSATDKADKAALQNEKTALTNLKLEIEKTVQETQNDISGLADKLSGLGSLTTTSTVDGESVTALTNLDQTLATIKEYSSIIAKLKERGVSASMLNYILNMNPEDAIDAANLLLDLSDSDWNTEMVNWNEIQSASQQVASESYAETLTKGIADNISANADALKASGIDLGTNLVDSMQDTLNNSVDDITDSGYYVGKNAADGVADGFSARQAHISSVFTSVLNSAMNAAKDFLGIASPSKLFRDQIGVYLAQGIGVGFSDEMAAVSQQMNRAIPASFNTPATQTQSSAQIAEGTVNGIASLLSSMQLGSGGTYQINVNIDGKTAASVLFDPLKNVAAQKGVSFA